MFFFFFSSHFSLSILSDFSHFFSDFPRISLIFLRKRNAEVKAAAQQSMTLSASTEELSVAMTESAIALAAEQKLRKSYEMQTKELEKEARKHARRVEEETRKSAERATSFSSELQQAQVTTPAISCCV